MYTVEKLLPKYSAFTVLSLFTGVRLELGVVVRPFDALMGLGALFLVGAASVRGRRYFLRKGIPYYLFLILYLYRFANGMVLADEGGALKELIQGAEFLLLIHLIGVATRTEGGRREFIRTLYIGFGTLAVLIAGWHIANSQIASYKDLGAGKLVFAVFSLLAIARYMSSESKGSYRVVIFSLILVVLSGERKGWVALAASVIFLKAIERDMKVFRLIRSLFSTKVVLTFVFNAFIFSVIAYQVEYVSRQVGTIYDIYRIFSDFSLNIDFSRLKTSGSNMVRLYLLIFSIKTLIENPVFGIGTDRWMDEITKNAGSLGSDFTIGAHSEYQRLAVENGLIGLVLYASIWIIMVSISSKMTTTKKGKIENILLCGLVIFGATINFFLAGGALNILYLALPIGLMSGVRTKSKKLNQ